MKPPAESHLADGDNRLSCADQVVPIAAGVIRRLRSLPPKDVFEEAKLPVRTTVENGASISFLVRRRIRLGLAERFRELTREVGEILAAHHNLTPLIQDSGIALSSDVETAGIRFLSRLVDAAIGHEEHFPRQPRPRLKRICLAFEAQLATGGIDVDWLYPLPGLTLAAPVELSPGVVMRYITSSDLEALYYGSVAGISAQQLIVQTPSVLAIRARIQMPFGRTLRENAETLHKLAVAMMLSALPLPAIITSWAEPREPSLYQVQQSQWFMSSLRFFAPIVLDAERLKRLKAVYRKVNACSAEVLESVPMCRALAAAGRGSLEDRLIDTWIALEALLLLKDEKSDMLYRMVNRAARLVRPPDLAEFRKLLRKGYDDRSRLVHGARREMNEEGCERLKRVDGVLRYILLRAVAKNELPNPASIDEAMLRRR